MFLLFANNAGTTLAGSISATSLTLNVAAGTGTLFPSPVSGQYFSVTLQPASGGSQNEIVWVTNKVGDQFTIMRGQEGTSPQSWNAGDNVRDLVTAGQMAIMIQQTQLQQQATNWAQDTGSVNAYAIALVPAVMSTAALTGIPIRFKALTTNTGAATLSVNGLSPMPIVTPDGQPLRASAILANGIAVIVSDGKNAQLVGGAGTVEGAAMAITGSGNVGGGLTVGGNLAVTGAATVTASLTLLGAAYLNNNEAVYWKNSSGTYVPIINVDVANNVDIISAGARTRILSANQVSELLGVDASGNVGILGFLTVNGASGLTVTGPASVGSTFSVSSNIVLSRNNTWIYGVASTGYEAPMFGVDGTDNVTINNIGGAYVRFVNQANTVNLLLVDNAGNATWAGNVDAPSASARSMTISQTGSATLNLSSNGVREYAIRADPNGYFAIYDATGAHNVLYSDTGANITIVGALATGGAINATGNVVANNGRLRASYGARNSGDPSAAAILADFTRALGGAGYEILPDGTMIQWGTASLVNTPGSTFAFNWAFPSGIGRVIVCEANGAGTWAAGQPTIYGCGAISTAALTVYGFLWNGSNWTTPTVATFAYIAIGW